MSNKMDVLGQDRSQTRDPPPQKKKSVLILVLVLHAVVLVLVLVLQVWCSGAPAGLPTLVFSLPTLPYVTVAHPAHRTEADLKEKASLATNQEGPPPLLSV